MSETLLGAIIGAVAAIIGGIAGQIITYFIDKQKTKSYNKQLTYELVIKTVSTFDMRHSVDDDLLVDSYYHLKLYGSKKVICAFEKYFKAQKDKASPEKCKELIFALEKACRAELGNKEKKED